MDVENIISLALRAPHNTNHQAFRCTENITGVSFHQSEPMVSDPVNPPERTAHLRRAQVFSADSEISLQQSLLVSQLLTWLSPGWCPAGSCTVDHASSLSMLIFLKKKTHYCFYDSLTIIMLINQIMQPTLHTSGWRLHRSKLPSFLFPFWRLKILHGRFKRGSTSNDFYNLYEAETEQIYFNPDSQPIRWSTEDKSTIQLQ